MADKTYQVVGHCALVTQDTPVGPQKLMLMRGAVIGAGAKQDEIDHNIEVGLLAEVGSADGAGVDAYGVPVSGGKRTVEGGEPGSVPGVAAPKQADAKAKADEDAAANKPAEDVPVAPRRNARG